MQTQTQAFTLKQIGEMESRHHGALTLAGAELGIETFGLQILDVPSGFQYPEHDHVEDGMEEVYVVLDGSGEFEIDGVRVGIDPGRMLRVDPAARRRLEPGPDGVRLLAIGCTAQKPYSRPESFRLGVQS